MIPSTGVDELHRCWITVLSICHLRFVSGARETLPGSEESKERTINYSGREEILCKMERERERRKTDAGRRRRQRRRRKSKKQEGIDRPGSVGRLDLSPAKRDPIYVQCVCVYKLLFMPP